MEPAARYLRHTLIDWFCQEDVSRARIGVVGAGAVGNEVLKCLALLGVGAIDVYDFDRIEIHNLTRSVLFRETDIGKNKAVCAAERLRDLDPNVKVTAYAGDFWQSVDLAHFAGYAAVICCVDNFEARIRLNTLCKLWGVNLINTGIDSRYAVVDTFPFSTQTDAGCYECSLPPSVYQRLSNRYSCGGLKKIAFIEKRIPTTVITASLAGSLAVSRALRFGSTGESGSRRIFADSIGGTSTATDLPRREDCPVCSRFKAPIQITPCRNSLGADLEQLGPISEGVEITLPEPVIMSFQCKNCGLGQGQDAPLFWRASDYNSGLANCAGCSAEGAVEIQIRDKLTAETLTANPSAHLPVPFVLTASDWGTQIFVFAKESDDGGRKIHH
ncbi:MAG: HesA/MoeB/ThiF family protein [Rhodospirillaceae bacterium]